MQAEAQDVIEKITSGDWSDETQKRLREVISTFADDFGYDLDEEGQPVEEGDSDRIASRPTGDEPAEDVGEETEEQEEAAGAAA